MDKIKYEPFFVYAPAALITVITIKTKSSLSAAAVYLPIYSKLSALTWSYMVAAANAWEILYIECPTMHLMVLFKTLVFGGVHMPDIVFYD